MDTMKPCTLEKSPREKDTGFSDSLSILIDMSCGCGQEEKNAIFYVFFCTSISLNNKQSFLLKNLNKKYVNVLY